MSSPLAVLAVVFGACAGAFVPRPAHRLAVPFGGAPRAACAVCGRPFPPGAPGWVRAGAACPCAGSDGRSWLTVLSAAAACGLLGAAVGPSPVLPVLLAAVVVGVLLAAVDLRCLRLPDPLVATLAVLVLPVAAAGSPARALLAVVVVGGGYLAVAVLSGGRLGLGDVKLAAVLAYVLGSVSWSAVGVGVLVAHLLNGSVAVVLLARGRGRDLPLGPALLAGALAGVTAA